MLRSVFHPLIAFVLLLISWPALLQASTADPSPLVQHGGYLLDFHGKTIRSHQEQQLFIPASSIKILTALTALNILGDNHRFATHFYYDSKQVLAVRGSGDPFLTAELLRQAVAQLYGRGVRKVSALLLDDSAFALERALPDGSENTSNPYDTGNGALAVNFNSVPFRRDKKGRLRQEDPHTPVLPLTREIARQSGPGAHRVNIFTIPQVQGSLPPALRYTMELLSELLRQQGITVGSKIRLGRVPEGLSPLVTLQSEKTVRDMCRECLKYSNNFVANQLALAAGARAFGTPASWLKARKVLEQTAYQQLHISTNQLRVMEGSGLSRQTMVTPQAMLAILQAFEPWKELLLEKHGTLLKSGTMQGVYCYAGYKELPAGTARFVILLNQPHNTRTELLHDFFAHAQ